MSPIYITAASAAQMAGRFDEALNLVRNEFRSLDSDEQYINSFSRLLKWDPLNRVTMLGTDQRDLFIPELRKVISASLAPGSHVCDIGCGDGQTFALVADYFPENTMIVPQDVNQVYLDQYAKAVSMHSHLRMGQSICGPFVSTAAAQRAPANSLEKSNQFDLVMVIHVIYYFDDLEQSLCKLYDLLKPGGSAFIVFADEKSAYTGQAIHAYYSKIGDTEAVRSHVAQCDRRLSLFAKNSLGIYKIEELLNERFPDTRAVVSCRPQESKLYGHTLADLIALCNITGLDRVSDISKFDVVADLLSTSPESVRLRIERGGTEAREGMLSVIQPQIVASITKGH